MEGMGAKREFRNRAENEVAVLDALVERPESGMTVFELRAQADVPIDELEAALGSLKADDLITVEKNDDRTVIRPAEAVIPDPEDANDGPSVAERIRDRLPF
jgi:predicted transcriptional regulator